MAESQCSHMALFMCFSKLRPHATFDEKESWLTASTSCISCLQFRELSRMCLSLKNNLLVPRLEQAFCICSTDRLNSLRNDFALLLSDLDNIYERQK